MVTWIIESGIFYSDNNEDNTETLIKEIKAQGHQVARIDYTSVFLDYPWDTKLEGPYIFLGSLQVARTLQRIDKFKDAVWCDLNAFDCRTYYPHYTGHLLNENHTMIHFQYLRGDKDWLYETFGQDDAIFIRPSSGNKVFSGQLVYKENFEKDVDGFEFYEPNPESWIVISEPINIDIEYRFFVVNGKVITGSTYNTHTNTQYQIINQGPPFREAQRFVDMWQPQGMFVIDLCRTKSGDIKIVEINAFSCSGQYGCDLKKIVESATNFILGVDK